MEYTVETAAQQHRRAIFLDRDGTLVYPRHYPSRPDELIICEGVVRPLRRLQRAGFMVVLITNQAGVAKGHLTEADLACMHNSLAERLRAAGVHLDAVYYCPHHAQGIVPKYSVPCDCRKPAPGMLLRAAADLSIDLVRSWFIGDILDDIEAGRRAGCRTVLVDLGTESLPSSPIRQPEFVARDTAHALRIILMRERLGDRFEAEITPNAWRWQPIVSEAV
jgi:D-glycero-D-manno-heptose 1,7-bisphosphate phosphatase